MPATGSCAPPDAGPGGSVHTPQQTSANARLVVSLQGIVRHFGRFAALRGVTAEFSAPTRATARAGDPAAGRLYLILGENGAGKSTLLRIMAGLLKPTRGSVSMLGATDLREVAGRVGYMGHAPLLYDELNALENLRYFAALYGIDDDARCQAAIRLVGLDPDLKRGVGQYSQGMRQRISLARAIVHDPELLLLDEPFSNVDVQSAREMARLLGKMRADGKTIFVVTHQPAVLEAVADETLLLSAGLLAARERGLPEYLKFPFSQPADHPHPDEDQNQNRSRDKGDDGACPSPVEGGER
jgi:ABC-type multidrug transport system ATPase subunit